MNTLAPTFLIGPYSFFQVIRTTSKSGQSSNFGQIGPRDAELQPLINVRNWFLLNILRMDGQNLTKLCLHIIIGKIYVATVRCHFSQICNGVTALDWCQKLVFAQYLENGWTEFNQILYTHDHRQDLYWYCKASLFWQMFNRVTALKWCQKLVFAQYLENGWTEFNQILYTLYHWHDLCLYCKLSFFRKFATELWPLIDVRIFFLLNILRMDGQNLSKFCIHIIIDKIYFDKVKSHFFANLQWSYGPWWMSEIGFCSISW